jgi:allophanate hydrolase subunit 1
MTSARSLHTATALANGTVLIAGGFDSTRTTLASAEIYDPITGLFTATGAMSAGRVAAEAVRLRNGQVLMVGGQDASGNAIASVDLYDPITGTFSPTGALGTPRLNPTVTVLKNGSVLVAGGYEGTSHGEPLATAEIYKPKIGRFVETGSMDTPRRNATATRLRDGTVLIAGGYNGEAVNSPELFNPRSGKFSAAAAMSTPRRYPSATLLPGGAVLVAGGFATATGDALRSSERFVRSSWSWLTGAQRFVMDGMMHIARGRHTATQVNHNTILMAGGYDGVRPLASAEIYNIRRQTFEIVGSMQTPRFRHTATPLEDGSVLVVGGEDANGALATAELFHLNTPFSRLEVGLQAFIQ